MAAEAGFWLSFLLQVLRQSQDAPEGPRHIDPGRKKALAQQGQCVQPGRQRWKVLAGILG